MMEVYSVENSAHAGNHENASEDSSSYELFYDSLSDIQDGEFSNQLSSFLSEEEINKSLEVAQKSITSYLGDDRKAKPESTYYFDTSLNSPEDTSSREAKVHDQEGSKRSRVTSPNSLLTSAQMLPEQKKQNTHSQESNNFCSVPGKQPCISALLPARPSFIRSLKQAERGDLSVQKVSPKSKPATNSDVPFKNKLCDKAATLIEELSSIFREAAKTRVRSPDGNSSSPDSGYLSPKNKQKTISNSLRNAACPEITPESELPEVTHAGESVSQKKEDSQALENTPRSQLMEESKHEPSAPQFTQKLRSQEVAEGSKVLLECRVAGNPIPHIRYV